MPKGVYKHTPHNGTFKKGRKGKISSTSFKKGQIAWNKGMKGLNSGKKNPFFGKKHSQETLKKLKETRKKQGSPWLIGKPRPNMTGDKHPNWKGGITLSEKSHKEFHKKYGIKNNTKEQLEEYLGRKI